MIYDERLAVYVSGGCFRIWMRHFLRGDVSRAWMIWSSAAEKALADCFSVCWRTCPCSGSWFLVGAWLVCVLFGLVVLLFVLLGGVLLIVVMMLMMSLFIVTSSAAPVLGLAEESQGHFGSYWILLLNGVLLWLEMFSLSTFVGFCCPAGFSWVCSVLSEYEAARVFCGVGESRRIVAEMHGRVSAFLR